MMCLNLKWAKGCDEKRFFECPCPSIKEMIMTSKEKNVNIYFQKAYKASIEMMPSVINCKTKGVKHDVWTAKLSLDFVLSMSNMSHDFCNKCKIIHVLFVCKVLIDHIYFVFDLDWITDSLVITEIFFLGSIRGNILLSTEGLQISTINMRTPCDKLMMSLKTKYFHTLSLPYIQERTKPKSSENHVIPMMINILKMILKLLLFRCVRGDTRYSLDSNLVNFQVSNNFLVVNMKKTRFVVWKEIRS